MELLSCNLEDALLATDYVFIMYCLVANYTSSTEVSVRGKKNLICIIEFIFLPLFLSEIIVLLSLPSFIKVDC